MKKRTPEIDIDDCVSRCVCAIDEIYYISKQLAAHMGIPDNYDEARANLGGIISRIEDMAMDLENIRDDAEPEE